MKKLTAKENLLRAIRHDRPQWVPNGMMEAVAIIYPPVVERPVEASRDSFGVLWSLEEGAHGGTFPATDGQTVRDLRAWREQVKMPDLDRMDWEKVRTQAKAINRDEKLVYGVIELGLFERSYLLLGMEEALMAFLTEPDLMTELVSALADYKIRVIERFDDVADLDMIWYGDDWGTQSNLFMAPEIWRRIIRPHTQRVYDCMKSRGIIIDQHSCGKIEAVFGDMVEMGADVWNPCQPCNDLAALKSEFGGRICFCGGIDSQFILDKPGVTADEVRAEVRKRIDQLAVGGGYIAGPSHSVPFKQDLLDAMNDEIAVYGKAVYRGNCR
jgi:uroporphyrinogen decarboxylase